MSKALTIFFARLTPLATHCKVLVGLVPSSSVWGCSHGIGMLCSPRQTKMEHCLNIYMSKSNIYAWPML